MKKIKQVFITQSIIAFMLSFLVFTGTTKVNAQNNLVLWKGAGNTTLVPSPYPLASFYKAAAISSAIADYSGLVPYNDPRGVFDCTYTSSVLDTITTPYYEYRITTTTPITFDRFVLFGVAIPINASCKMQLRWSVDNYTNSLGFFTPRPTGSYTLTSVDLNSKGKIAAGIIKFRIYCYQAVHDATNTTRIFSVTTSNNAYQTVDGTPSSYSVSAQSVGIFGVPCPSSSSTTNLAICSSTLPYTWNGLTFNSAGTQTAHLTNYVGCDSAATLNLTVKPISTSTTNTTICSSALPYTWNGLTFNAKGSQTYHTTNYVGCDSAATLNLLVNANPNPTITVTSKTQTCNNTVANLAGKILNDLYLHITSPVDTTFLVGNSTTFGPAISTTPVNGNIVYISPLDGCSAYTAGALTGKVALIDRGTCTFAAKVKNAQNAGAIGAVIVNNSPGAAPGMGGTDASITIPSISVSQSDGAAIKAWLLASSTVNGNSGVHSDSIFWGYSTTANPLTATYVSTIQSLSASITIQTPNYTFLKIKDEIGCVGIAATTAPVPVKLSSTSTNNATICSNLLPYTGLGHTINVAKSDTLHLTNAVGCDSLAIVNLTVTPQITYYADADNDGYGDAATSQLACTQPTGYVTNNTDCDDAEVSIHSPIRYYLDTDGDGYGGTGSGLFCSITAPTGYSTVTGDCNNNDALVHVAQTFYVDADNDGYGTTTTAMLCSSTATTGYSVNNLDCNDAKATATLAPVANAGVDRTICKGDTITIGTSAVSGTSYYWYTTTRLIGTQISNPKVYPSSNFKYVVLATNAGGCRMFDTMNVVVKSLPTVNAGIDVINCSGSNVTKKIGTLAIAGITYSWSPSTNLSSTTIAQPLVTPSNSTINYVLTATQSATGCTNKDTMNFIATSLPLTDAGTDRTICAGDTITIGSTAQVGVSYSWYTTTRLIGSRISNPKVFPTYNLKYIVLGVNAQGCRKFDTMNVTVNQLPIANAGIDKSIVTGGSIRIGTTAKSGLQYAWSPTTNLSSSTIANPISSATSTTNYVVKVTATATGCMKNDTMVLMVAPARIRSIVANQPNTIETINSDLNFNIYPNPSNGIANITFAESMAISTIEIVNMQGQLINSIKLEANQSQAELQQSNTNAGMYLVIAKNSQGEIIAKKTWVVSQ